MKRWISLTALCLLLSVAAPAQDWGLGLRFGSPTAFTLKHYFGNNAWDLSVGAAPAGLYRNPTGYYRGYGFSVMFNYLWRRDIHDAKGLEWYYGIGGMLTSRGYYKDGRDGPYNNNIAIGPTGALGLEYFIPNAPISLFLEANPYIELAPSPFYIGLGAAIGGRFTF